MVCHNCQIEAKKHGKDRHGLQRYRCNPCGRTFLEPRQKPLGNMYLAIEQAVLILQLLAEGNSIRSTERLTAINRNTILSLILLVGAKCERLLDERIQEVPVKDVQCDELWAYVAMKEKTKKKLRRFGEESDKLGDAYCFTAIERSTKLLLAWHLGRRTFDHTWIFTQKLALRNL
jgi:transposase-like protein